MSLIDLIKARNSSVVQADTKEALFQSTRSGMRATANHRTGIVRPVGVPDVQGNPLFFYRLNRLLMQY